MVHYVTRKYALEPEKLGSTRLHKLTKKLSLLFPGNTGPRIDH